jgi:hypothetical protein
LKDIFEVWNVMQRKDGEIRQDLKAEDPFVPARGLFLGSPNGIVRQEILREKAWSKDWPELPPREGSFMILAFKTGVFKRGLLKRPSRTGAGRRQHGSAPGACSYVNEDQYVLRCIY